VRDLLIRFVFARFGTSTKIQYTEQGKRGQWLENCQGPAESSLSKFELQAYNGNNDKINPDPLTLPGYSRDVRRVYE